MVDNKCVKLQHQITMNPPKAKGQLRGIQLGCLRNFVSSKFRIFRMFFLFRIIFESGNNFAKIIEIGGSFWGHGGSSWVRVGSP